MQISLGGWNEYMILKAFLGLLVAQWLGLCAATAGVWI